MYYPILLNIKDKLCIVIGGGNVAEQKIKGLLRCEALVRVISAHIHPSIHELINKGEKIEWIKREYHNGDLQGAVLVIGATDDSKINNDLKKEAKMLRIPANIVDAPSDCDFILPSVISRGHLQLSISTNGKSPGFSKVFREHLEQIIDKDYERLLNILGDVRQIVLERYNNHLIRKKLLIYLARSYKQVMDDIHMCKKDELIVQKWEGILKDYRDKIDERVQDCFLEAD